MIIEVTAKYRLQSAPPSWIVVEFKGNRVDPETQKVHPRWESIQWYPKLDQALCGLAELIAKDDPFRGSLEEAIDRLSEITEKVRQSAYRDGGAEILESPTLGKGAA